jgi:DMSO/TMAO reductase YedYZ molybdopterin-dependent catalytic subunit
MNHPSSLPPGQVERQEFPRFGLGKFARRFPVDAHTIRLKVAGDVERNLTVGPEVSALARIEQVSDFHCVTTWSVRAVRWSGFRFREFYETVVLPQARPQAGAELVVFRGQDGYNSCLLLEDLLADDVLLADRLNGSELGLEHGAPLRLVAPAHYGYKNVKHIAAIEFWRDRRNYRFPFPYPALMDHPRARVALEERGRWMPGWVFRYLYRPLIGPTVRNFRRALEWYRARRN